MNRKFAALFFVISLTTLALLAISLLPQVAVLALPETRSDVSFTPFALLFVSVLAVQALNGRVLQLGPKPGAETLDAYCSTRVYGLMIIWAVVALFFLLE